MVRIGGQPLGFGELPSCCHFLCLTRGSGALIFSLWSADECGIVAQISEPLATADIPAYYISTFKFDHALVRPLASYSS